jgi:hypothetical protein
VANKTTTTAVHQREIKRPVRRISAIMPPPHPPRNPIQRLDAAILTARQEPDPRFPRESGVPGEM